MSILIKGMKMPDKATTIVVFPEGKARVFRQDIDHDEWFTAIEVPKHGRLIDGIAIRHKLLEVWRTSGNFTMDYKNGIEDANEAIRLAPTIIEAEG